MEVKNILRMKHFFVSFGALGPDFTRPTKNKAEIDNSEKIKTKKKPIQVILFMKMSINDMNIHQIAEFQ